MMNFWLLEAIGDVDTDLVERANQPLPVRKMKPIRWTAAVAAVLVLALGVGLWFGGGQGGGIPVDPITPTQTGTITDSTTPTTTTTTTPTTDPSDGPGDGSGDGPGIGGDQWTCDVHEWEYHVYDSRLYEYVGKEQWKTYLEENKKKDKDYIPDVTYLKCPYPHSSVKDFVQYFKIPRETYIDLMGWGDYLDKPFQNGDPADDDMPVRLYTFGQWVDAIYGDDSVQSEWVLNYRAKSEYKDYQYYYYGSLQMRTRDLDPLYKHIVARAEWDGYDPIEYFSYEDLDQNAGLYAFLQYCGVTKEEFIDVYGWGDKLDQKATDHYKYAPYTYGQYVDALYGSNETLRSWLFNKNVFNPDYPTLEEYAKLSEGDAFYEAAPPIVEVERVELCHDHNPMYHKFDNFSVQAVQSFKKYCSDKGKDAFNIVDFVKYKKYRGTEFAWNYGVDLRKKTRNNIAVDHGEGCPYTYWQFYLAVCGSDPALTEWVFAPTSTWPQAKEWPPTGNWPPEGYGYQKEVACTVHNPMYHDLSYFPVDMVEKYKASVGSDNPEEYNLFDFINYHEISRHSLAEYLGFDYGATDPAMERIAVEFGKDVKYTYRQFVDAVYGDDAALTARVFGTDTATVTTTTTRDPNWGRDEFGNTTTRAPTTTTLSGHRP